jgi:hypothetical protein
MICPKEKISESLYHKICFEHIYDNWYKKRMSNVEQGISNTEGNVHFEILLNI